MYIVSDEDLRKVEERTLMELEIRRMLHSLSTGQVLYKLYPQIGKKNARVIALLHDIAHHWDREELLSYIDKHNIKLEDGEREKTILLHAPVDSYIMREMIPDCPDEWVNAIRRHTIPHLDMCELSYALFVADIIEPTRPFITDEERERVYNMPSNEHRMLYSMNQQEKFLIANGSEHLPCTKKLVNFLTQKLNNC